MFKYLYLYEYFVGDTNFIQKNNIILVNIINSVPMNNHIKKYHIRKSSCSFPDFEDISKLFKQFTKENLDHVAKDEHRIWKSKYRAKQRENNFQQVLQDQNRQKTKSRLGQQMANRQKVLDDQRRWKANSDAKLRLENGQKVKDDQKKGQKIGTVSL